MSVMEFLSKLNYERKHRSVQVAAADAYTPSADAQATNHVDPHPHQMSSHVSPAFSNNVGETVASSSASAKTSEDLPGSMVSKMETLEPESQPSVKACEVSIIMGQKYDHGGHPVSIMRFTNAEINPGSWRKCRMVRDLKKAGKETTLYDGMPETGAGSEYGARAREEAKQRKLMGRYRKKELKLEDQPWYLKASSLDDTKRFKGVKEGGISSHASYYIFSAKQDGAGLVYEAFPVQNWFDFKSVPRRNNFTAEEAEEKFQKRNEIYNFFSLVTRKRMGIRDENNPEEDEAGDKKRGKLIANEDEDYDNSGSSDDDNEKGGVSGKKKRGKDDFPIVNDNDDNEGEQEVDYMSSSQTSSSEVDEAEGGNESDGSDDEGMLNSAKLDSDKRKREAKTTKD